MKAFVETIIDDLTNKIINKNINEIDKKKLGFIQNNTCNLSIISILIHSVENAEIFNKSQENNIINIYNSIEYGK